MTSITTTFNIENTVSFVEPYTIDGYFYKIFIGTPGTTETIDLSAVASYITDRDPDCLATGIDLVTDETGTTNYTGVVFSENDFILTIDTSAPFYGPLFLKTTTYVSTVFQVDNVLVSVCGDQTIVNIDGSNPVFSINGNATDVSEWTVYSLLNIWMTTSLTLPDNECPITNIEICEDEACATLAVEADGVRISTDAKGDFQLEIDIAVFDADPAITHYFRVTSFDKFIIEPFNVDLLDCTDQVVSLAGDALAPIELEIGKNNGVLELLSQVYVRSLFSVSDPREACAIYHYRIYLTTTE